MTDGIGCCTPGSILEWCRTMNEECPWMCSSKDKGTYDVKNIFRELLLDMELQENYSRSLAEGGAVEAKEFLRSLRKQICW